MCKPGVNSTQPDTFGGPYPTFPGAAINKYILPIINTNNTNRRLVTLAEHTHNWLHEKHFLAPSPLLMVMSVFITVVNFIVGARSTPGVTYSALVRVVLRVNNNNNKRPLTPKSMPPAGDKHAKLKT